MLPSVFSPRREGGACWPAGSCDVAAEARAEYVLGMPKRDKDYALSSTFFRDVEDLARHISIWGHSDVKKNVSQDVFSTPLTEESEVKPESVFEGSTASGINAVMVCLRPTYWARLVSPVALPLNTSWK